jgi:hypothetical protein
MIIISCKYKNDIGLKNHFYIPQQPFYSGSSSTIEEVITACLKHMPNEKIVVVDSNSEDKTHYTFLKDRNIDIIEGNLNYEAGALWRAFDKYPNEEYYILLQDTTIPVTNLSEYINDDDQIVSFWYTKNWECNDNQVKEWAEENYPSNCDEFKSIIFNLLMVKNNVLKILKNKLIHNILPNNKISSASMERLWGIIFKDNDIKVRYLLGHLFSQTWGTLHDNAYIIKNFGEKE